MTFVCGLDLDGVVYHYDRTARYMLRRHIEDDGREVPAALHEPSRHWDWVRDHVSAEDWHWLWDTGVKRGLFRYGHVVGGAIEGVQALNQLGDVIAVTSRPKQAVHDTLVWLATMFDKAPLSGLVINSHGQSKSDVRPAPDVFIDDGAHFVDDLLRNTSAHVIMYDQPWNEGYFARLDYGHRFTRAHGWREVVATVTMIKEGR